MTPQTALQPSAVALMLWREVLSWAASKDWALNALTVAIATTARSTSVAATAVCARSAARRGPATIWEVDWMRTRMGTAERMTRVRGQEREKARARQVRVVVRYCNRKPEARDEASRTASVLLCVFIIISKR